MVYWIDNTALESDLGKKKDERKRREREAERAAESACGHGHTNDGHKDDGHKHARSRHEAAMPFAGIAAAVTKQLGTPAGRQMVAAGLMMAAAAISRQDAKTGARPAPPAPPEPPVTPDAQKSQEAGPQTGRETGAKSSSDEPSANPYSGATPEPPRGETPPLPPELAKVVGAVTSGLENLFAGFGKPRNGPPRT
jgi:hypothetical protein